jgi:hypothetical protein
MTIRRLADEMQLVAAIIPVNMATAGNAGDWVSLKHFRHVSVIVFKGIGAAGEDPVISILQAQAVAGTGSKALNTSRLSAKVGATALSAVGLFTEVTQAAGATYTDLVGAENEALWVFDIDAEDLDVENGFDCLSVSIADVGATAQLGCALYLLSGPRYATIANAIID